MSRAPPPPKRPPMPVLASSMVDSMPASLSAPLISSASNSLAAVATILSSVLIGGPAYRATGPPASRVSASSPVTPDRGDGQAGHLAAGP